MRLAAVLSALALVSLLEAAAPAASAANDEEAQMGAQTFQDLKQQAVIVPKPPLYDVLQPMAARYLLTGVKKAFHGERLLFCIGQVLRTRELRIVVVGNHFIDILIPEHRSVANVALGPPVNSPVCLLRQIIDGRGRML